MPVDKQKFLDNEFLQQSSSDLNQKVDVPFPPIIATPKKRTCSFTILCIAAFFYLLHRVDLLEQCGLDRAMFVKYVSIPFVSTIFTYVHIWAALWMTFYPLEYRGCLQIPETNMGCGWQGIVPSKRRNMAATAVKLMTERLISPHDVFARIDPVKVASELEPNLYRLVENIIEETARRQDPEIWDLLPNLAKNELIFKAREGAPPLIHAMISQVHDRIDKVFDLSDMVIKAFVREPAILNEMFISCGNRELRFIRDCGGYMGAGFGILQVALWMWWSEGWMLPTFGGIVGLLTNWMALKVIFEPVEPIYFCCGRYKLHGLFLQRQKEVSKEYAKIVSRRVLSARHLIPEIVAGKLSDGLFEVVKSQVDIACEKYARSVPMMRSYEGYVKGSDNWKQSKVCVAERLFETLPNTMFHLERYFDDAMDLENVLYSKLKTLPASDFEKLLHPVFQEDEWKLVLMGGFLGVVVGLFQWWALGDM